MCLSSALNAKACILGAYARALKNHRFRGEFVQIRRVNLEASIASKRIRALLIRQKKNQIWLSL
jgi:hypothetical protein